MTEPSRSQLIQKTITSIPSIIISKLPSSPPLLPLTNIDAQNLRKLELGKLAFTLGTTATLATLSTQKFPTTQVGYVAVVGLMGGCAAVLNGILYGKPSVEVVGIGLILACLYGVVGSFLPLSFSWACWLFGVFCLVPLLCLLIKPLPLAS